MLTFKFFRFQQKSCFMKKSGNSEAFFYISLFLQFPAFDIPEKDFLPGSDFSDPNGENTGIGFFRCGKVHDVRLP